MSDDAGLSGDRPVESGRSGHVIVAPDKFKGSLTAGQVGAAVRAGLLAVDPDLDVRVLPVADGGDGTLDAAVGAGFLRLPVQVTGPAGEPVLAAIAVRDEVAVVELALASGLVLIPVEELEALTANSFGTGELVAAALDQGCTQIILGVGGSASTDGGAGLLQALGARFLDHEGEELPLGGGSLIRLYEVDLSELDWRLDGVEFILASDVDNPLLGPRGAAHVYGPQKGASPDDVELLDVGLGRLADAIDPGAADIAGAGAAGGVGFAALSVLRATPSPGIEVVLDLIDFESQLDGARLVITGEGRLDEQTLHGKAPAGVADAADAAGVPVVAVSGGRDLDDVRLHAAGFVAAYALTDLEPDVQKCIAAPVPLLERIGRLIAEDQLGRMTEQPLGSLWRVAAVRQLMVVSLLGFGSYCLTLAALPSWALQGGSSRATAGLVTTVMLVTTVVAQALVPAAITRIGSGPALALGLLLLGAPAPLYALSSSLTPLLVLSAVRGLGFALITVIGATLTGVVAPASRHGEAVGIYGLSIALPNLVGVPAGVALTQAGHFRVVAVLAACPVLALPFALRLGGRPDTDVVASADRSALSHRAVLLATLAPSIVLMLVTAAGGGLVTFLAIQRPTGALATLALLVFGAAAALARWQAGILVDRVGPRVLLPGAVIAAACGMGGIGLCLVGGRSYDALLVVAAAVFGLGYGAVQNLTLVIAFARAGAAGAPTASALWNGAFDTGTALGAFAVGVIAAAGLGLPWAFAVSAAAVLVVLPIALTLRMPGRSEDPPAREAFA